MKKLKQEYQDRLKRLLINLDSLKDDFLELAQDVEHYEEENGLDFQYHLIEAIYNEIDNLSYDYEKLFGLDLYGGD